MVERGPDGVGGVEGVHSPLPTVGKDEVRDRDGKLMGNAEPPTPNSSIKGVPERE